VALELFYLNSDRLCNLTWSLIMFHLEELNKLKFCQYQLDRHFHRIVQFTEKCLNLFEVFGVLDFIQRFIVWGSRNVYEPKTNKIWLCSWETNLNVKNDPPNCFFGFINANTTIFEWLIKKEIRFIIIYHAPHAVPILYYLNYWVADKGKEGR